MPRSRISDFLQTHTFWCFDASAPIVAPVFTPFFGFSKITAPKINAEMESFKDGTFLYQRSVLKGASVDPITFERGASFFDSDFYDWVTYAIYGQKITSEQNLAGTLQGAGLSAGVADYLAPGVRRDLVVLHFSTINPGITNAINLGPGTSGPPGAVSLGPFEFAARIPARAWLLHNCVPLSYRSGGDFDASSAEISIMSLDVQPEWIEEFSLGLKP